MVTKIFFMKELTEGKVWRGFIDCVVDCQSAMTGGMGLNWRRDPANRASGKVQVKSHRGNTESKEGGDPR